MLLWLHRGQHSSGSYTSRPQSNKAGVASQSAYTLRGVGKWVFNQGHLAHLLFSPQPAFHPAPGEQGDR